MRRDGDRQALSQRLHHLAQDLEDLGRQFQPLPVRANQGWPASPAAGKRGEHPAKALRALWGNMHAPWPITTGVSCLPVLILGMDAALAALARLLRDDARATTALGSTATQAASQAHHGSRC